MKKLILILVVVLFVSVKGFAQNSKGAAHKSVVKIDSIHTELYNNGYLWQTTPYCKGKINGVKKVYDYNEKGMLIDEEPYTNGKKNGVWKVYFNTGKLKTVTPYANDIINGVQKQYNESGTLFMELSYTNGKLNGMSKAYYESGYLLGSVPYINGVQRGEIKAYEENGNRKYGIDETLTGAIEQFNEQNGE